TSRPHEIAQRLNAQYRAIEKSSDEMGRDLVLLKGTKPPGIEWGIYLKELGIEFSREYADRLIRRVEPKKPIEPKPAPEPSSEPVIENVDEIPEPPLSKAWTQSDKKARQEFVEDYSEEIARFLDKDDAEWYALRKRHRQDAISDLERLKKALEKELA